MALIKQRVKEVVLALICSIPLAYLCIYLFTPGSESSWKQGPLVIYSKTPSKVQKFLGNKTHLFEAKNNDENKTRRILVSTTTTEAQSKYNILQGREYMKMLWQSNEGRRRLYLLDIPPLETVAATLTSKDAGIYVLPLGDMPPDLQKILEEYCDVEEQKKNQ
jgi:hypothetical protein